MEMEDEESRVDFSSPTVDEDGDADEIYTEDGSDDEYGTSVDEDDDDDDEKHDHETTMEEEEDDAGPPIDFAEDMDSPPEWILLDVQGYIDARTNSTTAYACLSTGGGAVQVTFWAARPPRVSCFTVHGDGVKPNEFCGSPEVLAADDDLVLLRVNRRGRGRQIYISEYFVYQAAGAASTLRLLADLPAFSESNAGILCLGDGEFLVAAIRLVPSYVGTLGGKYDLRLFDSRTWAWSTRLMRVDTPERYARTGFQPTKVLTVGGERGSMALVDLLHGMLFFDLLAVHDDGAMLRYTPLPLPPSPSMERKLRKGYPSDVRNIAVVQGRIKFFEMRFEEKKRAITSTATLVNRYWEATAWEMTDPWQNWHRDCGLDIFKVTVDKTHPELPPHLHDMGKLHGEQPALSLHEEDVVYIMAKAKGSKRRAWMLAVDVRSKTLREVAAFDAGRACSTGYFRYTSRYLQSGMSSYLRIQSSAT